MVIHFDVTTAGSLDVYTDDHDLAASSSSLFIYKLDQDGHDWTLTNFNYEGAGPTSGPTNPNNIFGIHRTGYINEFTTGKSDAGVRSNFDLGSYVALVVGSQGRVTGHSPIDLEQNPTGAKLSAGFTWHWVNDDTSEVYTNRDGLVDVTIKASPLSSAIAGPTVEPVPVPGAVWLMGTVLAGFGAFGRKKSTKA